MRSGARRSWQVVAFGLAGLEDLGRVVTRSERWLAALLVIPLFACGGSSTTDFGASGAAGASSGAGGTLAGAGGSGSADLGGSSASGSSGASAGSSGNNHGGAGAAGSGAASATGAAGSAAVGGAGGSAAMGGTGGAATGGSAGSSGAGASLCSSSANATGCVSCCAANYPGAWQDAAFNNECLYCSGSCPGSGLCATDPPQAISSTCMQCVQSNWTGGSHCRFGSGPGCPAMVECVKRCPTN
jgi:hypothetical protein